MCLCERSSYPAPRAWINLRPVVEPELTSDAHLKFSVNSILGMQSHSSRQFRQAQRTIQPEEKSDQSPQSLIPSKGESRFVSYEKLTTPKKEMKEGKLRASL